MTAGPLSSTPTDGGRADRTLRDVVALSTLPAVWLGAEPVRVAESLAAAVFTILEADFVSVCIEGDAHHQPICVAQVGRNETDAALAAALAPELLSWARHHDPEDLMRLPNPRGGGTLRVTTRPLGLNAESGMIAAGFLGEGAPAAREQLFLTVAATQATTAIDNMRLLRSVRRQAQQLSGLAEATGAMLTASDTVDRALQLITERARLLIGAHQAVASMTTGHDWTQAVTAVSLSDRYAEDSPYVAPPDGLGLSAIVCRENRTIRMTQRELEAHPAWQDVGGRAPEHPSLRGWLGAPLITHHGANLGFIALSDKYQGEFTAQDEAILVQLARMASLVIEQRRAEAAQREAMTEAERARAEAEAASRAKDEFLAMLGHELRNPLAPIHTALQLMRLRGDTAADRERTVIERQVSHLTRLVDDLLDVSRIARGKVELKRERVGLAEVVAKAIEMASPLIEQRRHTLHVEVPRAGLDVDADALRLAQAISNLLTNAAKYTEPGGCVTIDAARADVDIVLRVRDTGVGLAPEMLPRVFDLFVQGRQSFDRSHGGLGLGLAIVRSLVAMHGGTVSARSDGLGHGSEFTVRLPAAVAAAAEAAPAPVPPTADAASARAAESRLRVLVVDDNEDAAEMLVSALRSMGYATRMAHDGPAALRICASFEPDVALLDLGLPVMDGYELAEQIRRQTRDGVLLIAATGYGQAADLARSRAAGFDHHLVKPLDLHALERILRDAEQPDALSRA